MAFKKSCSVLKKVHDSEPIFVLRAHDLLALSIVKMWAWGAALIGTDEKKVSEAIDCSNEMTSWQEKNGSKNPD